MIPTDLRQPAVYSASYRRLAPGAHAAARAILGDPVEAEDVVQDVFTTIWSRPDAFDPGRGSLATFVNVMARSRALDRRRSQGIARGAYERVAADQVALRTGTEEPEETVIRRDLVGRALDALEHVPDRQREAVLLTHVRGLSHSEVARATRTPLGTAKSRVRLGLNGAREHLAQVA
jgi:RNA polymerase sigma-70 factor, ECF subfamily